MAARRQQTHAKRARELAVKEKRERKAAKKEARAAGEWPTPDDDEAPNLNAPETAGEIRFEDAVPETDRPADPAPE